MTKLFLIALLLCYWVAVGARPLHKRGPLSYVVDRGCMFLAHYVHDNYYDYHPAQPPTPPSTTTPANVALTTLTPATTTHINWVTHLYRTMTADYVPLELFKGLVVCGKTYAMFAINAPNDLRQTLHVDYSSVPGLGFGK